MKKVRCALALALAVIFLLPSWAAAPKGQPRLKRPAKKAKPVKIKISKTPALRPPFGLRGPAGLRQPIIIQPEVIERPLVVSPALVRPVERPLIPRVEPLSPPRPRSVTQLGLSGGYLGGIPGLAAEVRFFEPFALAGTSLRLAAGYASGAGPDKVERKHALAMIDGVYHLNPPDTPGVNTYLGAGVNYDVYTTGRVSGSVGGEVYLGLEAGSLRSGQMFVEAGYGKIRTGFSPSSSGLNLMTGFRI